MSDWLPDAPDTRSLGSVDREWLNLYIGDAGKIYFRLDQSVNLYGSAADVLKTDDSFVVGGNLLPAGDDSSDLGSSTPEWKDLYVDGVAYLDTVSLPAAASVKGEVSDSYLIYSGGVSLDDARIIVCGKDYAFGAGDIRFQTPNTLKTSNLSRIIISGAADLATISLQNLSKVFPYSDDAVSFGDATHEFKDIYIDGLAYIDGFAESILPSAADSLSLGSTSAEWLNLYIGDAGKIYFGLGQDVNLYRSPAGYLRTDDVLEVGDVDYNILLNNNSQYIWFGDRAAAWDVNLYRSAADVLKTDDSLDALALLIGGTEVLTSGCVLQNVTADTGIITSGRFGMPRMPDGTSGYVLTAQGSGVDPAYAAPSGNPDISAKAYNSAVQSIPKTAFTVLNNDSEDFDTDTIHDLVTNNSRLTCKTAGKYVIIGQCTWDPNTAADLVLNVWYNNTNTIGASVIKPATGYINQQVMVLEDLVVDDYVELRVWHNATAAVNCKSGMFGMIRVA